MQSIWGEPEWAVECDMGGYKTTTLQIKTHSFGWNRVRKSFLTSRACWHIQCNHVRRVSTANFACWLVLVCCNLQSLSSEFSAACLSLTRCNLVFLSSEVSFPFFRVLFCCKLACLSLAIWVVHFRLKECQFAFTERRTYGRYII